MTTTVLTQQEIYDIYKDEVTGQAPEFTDFSVGAIHDIIAGALSIAVNEVTELIISEFMKTFFSLAEGDDLDKLAVDHFGDTFARPAATLATGIATFSRPNTDAGDVSILAGTIIKTKKNASGEEIRFQTDSDIVLTGTSISVTITAMLPGVSGNVNATNINTIETALTDASVTVNNSADMAGGKEKLNDEEYREFIKAKILSLAGATEAAILGAALSVSGVAFARAITLERVVIDYDIANDQILPGATFFRIPYPVLYIADAGGNSSPALIESVLQAINLVKALGVKIEVRGAVSVDLNWTASLTLNGGGPNYAELSTDLTKITESMSVYINEQLAVGQGFNRASANAYILSVWGASGTNDLTSFSTSVPSGDVSIQANEKLIAGTMDIV
jgi:hypothetical protein